VADFNAEEDESSPQYVCGLIKVTPSVTGETDRSRREL